MVRTNNHLKLEKIMALWELSRIHVGTSGPQGEHIDVVVNLTEEEMNVGDLGNREVSAPSGLP